MKIMAYATYVIKDTGSLKKMANLQINAKHVVLMVAKNVMMTIHFVRNVNLIM